jgi:prepilin-type N-terminal cleavage/methylation domain-containing protein
MKQHRLKAFTILEVTITMLIAGVLIGIAYTSYSIVIKSYHSFTSKNEDMAVLINLDHLLKRDFEKADTILKDTGGIVLTKDNTLIKYAFTPDFVIRTAARVDTFKVQTQELNTTFENVPIVELQATSEENKIDGLDFILIFQSEKIPFHYRKLYSSENLILRNPKPIRN